MTGGIWWDADADDQSNPHYDWAYDSDGLTKDEATKVAKWMNQRWESIEDVSDREVDKFITRFIRRP